MKPDTYLKAETLGKDKNKHLYIATLPLHHRLSEIDFSVMCTTKRAISKTIVTIKNLKFTHNFTEIVNFGKCQKSESAGVKIIHGKASKIDHKKLNTV